MPDKTEVIGVLGMGCTVQQQSVVPDTELCVVGVRRDNLDHFHVL